MAKTVGLTNKGVVNRTEKPVNKKHVSALIYQAAREKGATSQEAYELTGRSKNRRAQGAYEMEKQYKLMLLKPKNVRDAVRSVNTMVKGCHPNNSELTIDPKHILEASKIILDRAVPQTQQIQHNVASSFTSVPLEEIQNQHIIDITPDNLGDFLD